MYYLKLCPQALFRLLLLCPFKKILKIVQKLNFLPQKRNSVHHYSLFMVKISVFWIID